jgi:hypothetical protein
MMQVSLKALNSSTFSFTFARAPCRGLRRGTLGVHTCARERLAYLVQKMDRSVSATKYYFGNECHRLLQNTNTYYPQFCAFAYVYCRCIKSGPLSS